MSSLRMSYRFTGPPPIRRAKFPAFVCDRFIDPIKLKECQGKRPRRVSLVWRQRGVCEMVVHDWFQERGVTLLLSQGLADWWHCVVLAPPLCELLYKLEQLQCQLRLLCKRACEVRCGVCNESATKDNTTVLHAVDVWRSLDDLIPSKVTSDYSVSDWD